MHLIDLTLGMERVSMHYLLLNQNLAGFGCLVYGEIKRIKLRVTVA